MSKMSMMTKEDQAFGRRYFKKYVRYPPIKILPNEGAPNLERYETGMDASFYSDKLTDRVERRTKESQKASYCS